MKTVRIRKIHNPSSSHLFRCWLHLFLVDVLPVILLLMVMAFSMAYVCQKFSPPCDAGMQLASDMTS